LLLLYHYTTTITNSVPHPSGDGALELLKDINGYAKPGTMTALMGSSGAGK
jgi:ABC-type multidrug transport system ATPase subunit